MITISLPTNSTQKNVPDTLPLRRDLLTPVSGDEYLLVLDNSSLDKIKRCHAAAFYYLGFKREGHARNAALVFGGAIHQGLEQFYLGASEASQDKAIADFFLQNPPPPDEYRTVENALIVMEEYRKQVRVDPTYRTEPFTQADGRPIVERPFELPIGVLNVNAKIRLPQWEEPRVVSKIHVAWAGKIDLVGYANEHACVLDHKTSSIDSEHFIQGFTLSSQVIGYIWAANQMVDRPEPITKFCLNCLRIKRPAKNTGLTERGPRGGEPALKFFRHFFSYSPSRMEEWRFDTLCTIEDFVFSLVRGNFPLNDRNCFDKFGCCEYREACTIDDQEVRQRLLQSDGFKPVTWDPTL